MANEEQEITIIPDENAIDLDAAMKAGMDVFSGELEEAAGKTQEPGTETPAGTETETEEQKNQPETQGGEKAAETEKPSDESEKPSDESEESAGAEEGPEFRFESHEKAEEGYREIQSKATRAEQRAAELQKKLDGITAAEKQKEISAENRARFRKFSKEQNLQALKSIDELDPDDFEDDEAYQERVSDIWTDKDEAIEEFRQTLAPSGTPPEGTQEAGDETPADDSWETAVELAQKAGVDPESETFLFFGTKAPVKDDDGNTMDFEAQVNWAVNKTKAFDAFEKGEQPASLREAARDASVNHQKKNRPLGRGSRTVTGNRRTLSDKKGIVTLDDAIQDAQSKRVL